MHRPADYPFQSYYLELSDVKIHFLDEGNKQDPPLLLLHGVPTWSYTFRNMIPLFVKAGIRVIAPDLPGFGLSEKPIPTGTMTFQWMVDRMDQFIHQIDLKNPFILAHDWGGVIGLMLASVHREVFSGIVLCNSLLPVPGMRVPLLFRIWRAFSNYAPVIPVGLIIQSGTRRRLSRSELEGYRFPFQCEKEKTAIRLMPGLLPTGSRHREADLVHEAWTRLSTWDRPVLTIFSDGDPITRGGEQVILDRIPGASDQKHCLLHGGHFLQEDAPEEVARQVSRFIHEKTWLGEAS
jgi:haloalkane dehalogenase